MSLLTPELAALEGRTVTYSAPEPLGRASVRYFARAVGATDPIHWDIDAATDAGHADVVAPPTMIFETNQYMDVEPDAHGFAGHAWGIEVPNTRLIRGGNAYRFHAPVLASTVPEMTWTIESVTERSGRDGRTMLIIESLAECRDQRGTLLAENTETLIYQELPA